MTVVWVTIFSATLSSQMIIPIIGLFATLILGAGPLIVGLVYGVGTLSTSVFMVPAAMFSGRYGLRKIMASGMGLTVLGSLVYGLSTTPKHMILASLLTGVGNALFYPSMLSTIYEEAREDEKSVRRLGYILTAPAMGMVLGPAVGSAALSSLGYQATFFTSAAISFTTLATMRFVKENKTAGTIVTGKRLVQKPPFSVLLATCLLVNYVTGAVYAFLPIALKITLNYEEHVIVLFFSAAALANLSARIAISSFSIRFDMERSILIGSFLLAISSTMLIFLNPFTAWAGIIVYGFGMGVFILGSIYLTGKLLPPETRTTGFALLTLSMGTGNALGNFFSGAFLAYGGVAEVFAVAAALATMGMAVGQFGQRFQEKPLKHFLRKLFSAR
jgi:MFS family permease